MVKQLWSNYGNLTEIWVDSGTDGLDDLMEQMQPHAVNSPGNPVRWCGTESGHPSITPGPGPYGGDIFSTDDGSGTQWGDPNGTAWVPKFCDPQLFQEHVWFWEPNLKVRTLAMMIPIYHDIVGRGMVMELAFSIDRDGLVEDTHAAVYKQLGDWVRACYGTPLSATSGRGNVFTIAIPKGATYDRLQLREDTISGQRVRGYTVDASVDGGKTWSPLVHGQAIGTKRIKLLNSTVVAPADTQLRLTVTAAVATPLLRQFAVFAPCASGQQL